MKVHIREVSLKELQNTFVKEGYPKFAAGQVYSWLYKKGARSFNEMSNLSLPLRERLRLAYTIDELSVARSVVSRDFTEKILFAASDGNTVEAVSIPFEGRVTGCVSSQAGCKFACAFCSSGALGFKRDLTAGEILDEVAFLRFRSKAAELTHIVFMGMGEPFDNYDNVLTAVKVINSKDAFNIGARRITISTCGVIPGIERLSREGLQVELSVSLHAANDKLRSALMPVNRKYPLKELIAACRRYIENTDRQVTFEYTMLSGVNAAPQHARALGRLLSGMNCKVNLIPINAGIDGFTAPGKLDILLFQDCLKKMGIPVTIRRSRGGDIDAACGQLRLRHEQRKSDA